MVKLFKYIIGLICRLTLLFGAIGIGAYYGVPAFIGFLNTQFDLKGTAEALRELFTHGTITSEEEKAGWFKQIAEMQAEK